MHHTPTAAQCTRRLCIPILLLIVSLPMSALAENASKARDLGDILLEKGVITKDELEQAREETKQKQAADESRMDALKAKLPKWLDYITPFGDVRVREEGFYQEDKTARNRGRVRARLGLNINPSDEISSTIRIATGDSNDPISTNQSFQNTFTQKSINLNQAYLTLKPGKTFNLEPGLLTVVGGKFGLNNYRPSELVWDDDVSPEGATQIVSVLDQRERSLKLNVFEWVVDEVSNSADPWMFGGQVVGESALPGSGRWTIAFADYHYEVLDSVATKFLSQYTSSANPTTGYASNPNFNSSLANSNTVTLSPKDVNGHQKVTGYANGFNLINPSTELNFADPFGLGIPAGVFGDLVYNSQADSHNTGFYIGAGIGNAGKDWYRNPLKNPGDWGIGYTWAWVEKDAVLSIFTFSDINEYSTLPATPGASQPTQKGGTNLSAHIVRLDYVLLPNLQLTAKAYIENVLDRKISNAALTQNPTLVRTQLDAQFKF